MKKVVFILTILICVCLLVSCDNITADPDSIDQKYKVEILNADQYDIVNELKESYLAGEKVTIQLSTITEHYYLLSVNGVRQEPDDSISDDWTYTYYTFIMPNEDVIIEIEDRWVDIPEPPQE